MAPSVGGEVARLGYSTNRTAGKVAVAPGSTAGARPRSAGSPDAPYNFMMRQPYRPSKAVRWDPCRTLKWRFVRPKPGDRRLAAAAFRKIAAVTGKSFRQVGKGPADIKIRYSRMPDGNTLGIGGFRPRGQVGFLHVPTAGSIRLSYRIRNLNWQRRSAVMLHELAHVYGLGHVKKRSELMYHSDVGQREFGPGDRAGLQRLARGGCVELPKPARVVRYLPNSSSTTLTLDYRGKYPSLVTRMTVRVDGRSITTRGSSSRVEVPGRCDLGFVDIILRTPYGIEASAQSLDC